MLISTAPVTEETNAEPGGDGDRETREGVGQEEVKKET